MNRVIFATIYEKWPDGDIWMDVPMKDILNTMIGAITSASSRVKAVSISSNELTYEVADELVKAADEKGIHIVWVNSRHVRLNPPKEMER
jgi:pyruvate-formate lyase-activating enzyme